MDIETYLKDPCGASSLPFWKTESLTVPDNVRIVRDDELDVFHVSGHDETYFKLVHDLRAVKKPVLPDGYEIARCGVGDFADQINSCYRREHVSAEELLAYRSRSVYRPELWIAVSDAESGIIAATGIAELDARIGEGILEWIQVLPGYRRKGLGAYVVCELLRRMRDQASFVTVSGRMDSDSSPFSLYRSCGFTGQVSWHVIRD